MCIPMTRGTVLSPHASSSEVEACRHCLVAKSILCVRIVPRPIHFAKGTHHNQPSALTTRQRETDALNVQMGAEIVEDVVSVFGGGRLGVNPNQRLSARHSHNRPSTIPQI